MTKPNMAGGVSWTAFENTLAVCYVRAWIESRTMTRMALLSWRLHKP